MPVSSSLTDRLDLQTERWGDGHLGSSGDEQQVLRVIYTRVVSEVIEGEQMWRRWVSLRNMDRSQNTKLDI